MFLIRANEDLTIIRVTDDSRVPVEFRGETPYHLWPTPGEKSYMAEDTQRLHDYLEGWHACVLHADDILALLPKHPDYSKIEFMMLEVAFDELGA